MSIHSSLVIKAGLNRQRSVLNRMERIEKLAGEGRWREGDSVYKLPKVRTLVLKKKAKEKKKEEDAGKDAKDKKTEKKAEKKAGK